MSKVSGLITAYEKHIRVPWQQSLAGSQRVLFAVYDKTDQLRLRAHVTEFELVTRDAGHDWHLVDLTDAFPIWMASVKYKESYFENPDDLDGYQTGEVTEFTSDLIKRLKSDLESNQNPNQVTALLGVGTLFGVSHVSISLVASLERVAMAARASSPSGVLGRPRSSMVISAAFLATIALANSVLLRAGIKTNRVGSVLPWFLASANTFFSFVDQPS